MSNTSYLLAATTKEPTAPNYKENVLLEAPNHFPLLWLASMAADEAYVIPPSEGGERNYPLCGALVDKTVAIKRLRERAPMLQKALASRGDVGYHIELFAQWLEDQQSPVLCFEWTEYNCLNGDEHERIIKAIGDIDALPGSSLALVEEISTIIPGARFITLDQAKSGNYTQEEMFTFFRIFGDSYTVPVPWR